MPVNAVSSRPPRVPTWILSLGAALIGVAVVARLALGVAYANRIYPGVRAAGLDLGGLTVEQASAELAGRLSPYANQPVTVQLGNQTLTRTPAELGFRADPAAVAQTAYDVGRRSDLINRLAGPLLAPGLDVPLDRPVLLDEAAVQSAVKELAVITDRAPIDAQLTVSPALQFTPSQAGQSLDQTATQSLIENELLQLSSASLVLPLQARPPAVTTAQLAPVRDQVAQLLAGPVALQTSGQSFTVPSSLVQSALQVRTSPVGLDVDSGAFQPFVAGIAKQIDRPARDARIVIADARVTVEPEQTGQQLDPAATANALRQALAAGQLSANAVVQTTAPTTTAAALQDTASQAQHLIDQGLVLTAENQSLQLGPADLAKMVRVAPDSSGNWTISLDSQQIAGRITALNQQFAHPSQDARFGWANGKLTVLQSPVPAVVIDQAAATKLVLSQWQKGTVALPLTNGTMTLDDAALARLNQQLREVVQERSTSFAGSIPERAHNIGLALSKINGSYVPPGATFSFDKALGPTTLAAGFQWGFAYATDDGGKSEVVPSVAGGICQVATTLFQPVFWAGYQIEERHWHMFAMHSYADNGYLGLDATVDPTSGLDFQFTNDTDNPVLIVAGTEGTNAQVQLISTKPDWTVKVSPEQVSNVVQPPPGTVRTESPLFQKGREIVLEAAQPGLTSQVTRQVVYPDGHVRTLSLKSTYEPAQTSILVGTG
jgi:vancomycin resistance protein YoaR